jgi:DNA-binding HxlR family transcriptional regulator
MAVERSQLRRLFTSDECSISRTVGLIGDRWSLLILREAFYDVTRFEDLHENLTISRAVLSERLDRLVEVGLLHKVPYQLPGQRARYEYHLSADGIELIPAFVALLKWGDKHRDDHPPIVLRHQNCGGEVSATLTCSIGHVVTPEVIEPELHPHSKRRFPPGR